MATLLMVESWLRSTGLCLPPMIRRLEHEYVLFTSDPTRYGPTPDGRAHPVVAEADETVVVDTNDLDAVVDAAARLAGRRRVDGVLTTCDYYLDTVAAVAAALGLPGARPEVMHRATRKHLVRTAVDEAGMPTPAFAAVDSWEQARVAATRIGYPLIAKPVDLNAGTAVQVVDDEAALKDAFWAVTGIERNTRGQPLERLLLLEELMEGDEVSVEAVTLAGRTTVLGITDKSVTGTPARVESGHMFPARLEPEVAGRVEEFVVEVLAAVGYTHGLSHTEVMITSDGPRLVELNPRQGGGYIFELVHLVTGAHPLAMLVDLTLGRMPALGGPAEHRAANEPVGVRCARGGLAGRRARPASAAVRFVLSPRDGELVRVSGLERFDVDAQVRQWSLPVPATVRRPRDNDDCAGYVLTADPTGLGARTYAEELVSTLRLHFDDGEVVAASL